MQNEQLWAQMREQIAAIAESEPLLAAVLRSTVLAFDTLEESLACILSEKLASRAMEADAIRRLVQTAFLSSPDAASALRADLAAHADRDPSVDGPVEPFLHHKGFHALEAYRVSHWLWHQDRKPLARFFQSRISEVFGVDIHPAAHIGKGLFIDHATGLVIGETAVVGDNVSMLHEVTLGGTGKKTGERHPKVEDGVLIGAGAKILGNVRIGAGAKVSAGSVVLEDVPAHTTVAGVPAQVIGRPKASVPSLQMDQSIEIDRLSVRASPHQG